MIYSAERVISSDEHGCNVRARDSRTRSLELTRAAEASAPATGLQPRRDRRKCNEPAAEGPAS